MMYLGNLSLEAFSMKYVKQFLILLTVCFAGELCRYLIPLPIPASIYGLVIMLIALITGIIKLEQVEETAVFLVEIMPVMFIPAGVGLLESYHILRPHLAALTVITIITTIIVMGITGITAQFVMRHKDRGHSKEGGQA